MFRSLLVSFCNNIHNPSASPLLLVQIAGSGEGQVSVVPLAVGFPDAILSTTGLTRAGGVIYSIFGARTGVYVSALRECDLSPLFFQKLPEVRDPHSILAVGDCLYVTSTGTDELLCYDIREQGIENPRVAWRASDGQKDTHHLNSVVEKDGEILITAFGPKAGTLWATSLDGYVHNVTTGATLYTGLGQPHSLSLHNDRLYYSDSHRNTFRPVDQPEPLFHLAGYTRGVTWLGDNLVCLGTSIGRKVSKSTGLVANPGRPGERAGECCLWLGDVTTGQILRRIDLSGFGPEIYDVLFLPDAAPDLAALQFSAHQAEGQALAAISQEAQDLQEQVQAVTQQLQAASQELQQKDGQLQVQDQQLQEQRRQLNAQAEALVAAQGQAQRLADDLQLITGSRAWRAAVQFQRLRAWLVPHGSGRARFARRLASLFTAGSGKVKDTDA